MSGEYSLGQPLSESYLSEVFNVSKTPVREALFTLKQEGLIDIIPQKGSFVFQPDEASIQELCQFRSYLEPIAIVESLRNNRDEFMENLEVCIVKMSHKYRSKDFAGFLELDSEFHESFFRYCGNTLLQKSYHLVQYHIGAIRSHLTSTDDAFEDIIEDHRAIYQYLLVDDIDNAQQYLKNHVLDIKSLVDTSLLSNSA
ncbi:hypothetical protein BCT12_18610 [Vibrio breoganii]|nr:hypothetical protein BCT12_18610 [Vibrio breoganii]